jgi:hypothetical protein
MYRIEIENYNKKILDMYDNPIQAYIQYAEEIPTNIKKDK